MKNLNFNLSSLSRAEYHELARRAQANGVDKPIFRQVCSDLEEDREARTRLAQECLSALENDLSNVWDLQRDAEMIALWALEQRAAEKAVCAKRIQDGVEWLLKLAEKTKKGRERTMIIMTLPQLVRAGRVADPDNFNAWFAELRQRALAFEKSFHLFKKLEKLFREKGQ